MVYRKRNRSMSRRKRPGRTFRKKTMRNSRRFRKSRIPSSLSSVPTRLHMKFNYAYNGTWSVPNGTAWYTGAYFQSSLYSPQIPTGTGGAHQPMYFDQFCPAIYWRYRVYGIKYRFRFSNYKINEPWYAAVEHNNKVTSATDLLAAMERPNSKVKVGGQQYSNSNKLYINGYLDVAKTLGVPKNNVRTDNDYAADYNATPTAGFMALLVPELMHNNSTPQDFSVTGQLKFYAILEMKIPEAKS